MGIYCLKPFPDSTGQNVRNALNIYYKMKTNQQIFNLNDLCVI